jgi:16S rRNA (guanine527-N7)-methyltransferase
MGAMQDHSAALAVLGLTPLAVQRLTAYLDLLDVWATRVNLTGLASTQERVRVLVSEVLPALPLVGRGRLIDIGSGNGSPGLVLAALRDDLEVVLLEPRQKRWAFLREAARAMGRAGIEVLRLRHDQYRGAPAETVTLRALALPLDELAHLVMRDGRLLLMGRQPLSHEGFVLEAASTPSLSVLRRCST